MRGQGPEPRRTDDYVEIPPAEKPIRVAFDAPSPTPEQEARPVRVAALWIAILVILGLFWSTLTPDEPAPRSNPPRRSSPGTTAL